MTLHRSHGPSGAERFGGNLGSPADGACDDSNEQGEFAGHDEAFDPKIEAASLGVAEEAFDGPALAVGCKDVLVGAIAGDDQEFAALDAPCGKAQAQRPVVADVFKCCGEAARPPAFGQLRAQIKPLALFGGDQQCFAQVDDAD
jgi:hypothetical protein